MKPVAKWLGWAIVAALVVIQFVQPARTNPPVVPEATIFTQTQMPEDVAGLLIVVSVALDTMGQIEAHLVSKRYEGFGMGGGRVRGRLGR